MESTNGALSFDVLIKDNNLQAMLAKDEQRIKDFARNVESNSDSITSSFDGIGKAIGGLAIGATLQSWVSNLVSVRGEFQQLEIAFKTMLGSAEQANSLMAQLVDTAATTPFDLKGVAGGAKQLLAYGESAETVNDTLVRLGNIASGLSIPLNDIVYLYGTTMTQGRLFTQDVRQFMGRGIPLVQELGKELGKTTDEINQMVTDGKIGFPEVQKVINNLTNEGGMFYNLMEEQSKSLTGQLSNLEDALDMMLNEMGQSSQDLLGGGISIATSLVENYKDVLAVVKSLCIAYGTYKAAVISLAVAQKSSTGIASLDTVVLKARQGMFTSLTAVTSNYIKEHTLMTTAQKAYTLELQKAITVEQQEEILRNLKTASIQRLLTEEQKLYISRLNLTAGSTEYIAVAQQIMTADQNAALSKLNLTRESAAYGVAVQNVVNSIQNEQAAQMAALRTEAAVQKQKQATLMQEYRVSLNKIQATRVQIQLAMQEGNAEAVAALQEKQHTQLKEHAVIVTNMKNAKLAQEAATQKIATLATQQASVAGKAKAATDTMQAATTSLLSKSTTFLIAKLRALWATMLANPVTAIISVIGLALSAFTLFGRKTEEETTIQGEFQDALSESYSKLNAYFAILKNADSNTKTYQDALGKINQLCSEHHVELLKENAALGEQVKKHDELIEAMERETAAKLKAKYTEQALQEVQKKQEQTLKDLVDSAKEATNKVIEQTTSYDGTVAIQSAQVVDKASENIQNASDALWEGVIARANEGAKQLQGLTGEAYTTALNNLIAEITKAVQDGSKATSKEMEAFKPAIEKAITETVEAANEGASKVNLAISQTDAFINSLGHNMDTSNVKQQTDYASMSFEELEKQAQDAQTKIDSINGKQVKISTDNKELQDTLNLLNLINGAIGKKEAGLNTENGINERIKQLKALRAEAVIGSKEWKDYDARISRLEGKLPSTHKQIASSAKSAASKAASEAQKRQEAARDAAQKEIELSESLEQSRIDIIKDGYEKRKRELELQHTKELNAINKEQQELERAYKKAGKRMSKGTAAKFDEKRTNENARYAMEMSGLTDVEIEEKKKAYQAYYKWVSTYGVEVADQQYAKLVAQGKTYTEWLQKQVEALTAKEATPDGLTETESNQLISYQAELNSITGVKTAMQQFNEELTKSKDDSKELTEYLKKLVAMKQQLETGSTNLIGEDKAEAIRKVDEQVTKATTELQKKLLEAYKSNEQMRYETTEKYDEEITWLKQHGYDEQAALAEKAKVKALSELEATKIEATSDWKELFNNAQYLSGSAFDAIIEKLRKMVAEIQDSDVKNALTKQLDELEQQTQGSRNPFRLLTKSIKEYNKAVSGTTAKKKALSEMFTSISSSVDMVKQSFDSVVDGLQKMGLAGDEETQAMLGDISDMMGGASTLAQGFATMNPAQMISGGVSVITSAISLFDSTSRRIRREMKQHETTLKKLQNTYNQISFDVDNAVGEDYYKEQQKAIKNLQEQSKEYEELARLERSKKKKDRDDNKVLEYQENAKDALRKVEEIKKEIAETLVQTNFKDLASDLADSWVETFGDAEESMEAFDNTFKKTIANAVKNSLKLKLIEPVVSDFTDALATYMGAHDNSVAGFNFEYWKKLLQGAGDKFTEGLESFKDFFDDATDEIEDASLEGDIKGVSEETAGKLAGEITTLRVRQAEMIVYQKSMDSSLRSVDRTITSCLSKLNTIAQNTAYNRYLYEINNLLISMKTNTQSDPLRAKGLNT